MPTYFILINWTDQMRAYTEAEYRKIIGEMG